MGYAVYEDQTARDYGIERWAGYGVPAICDMPDCEKKIDRGMGYRCEESKAVPEEEDDDPEFTSTGCGLHFCAEHLDHSVHGHDVRPKPDLPVWEAFIVLDESWATWRSLNPQRVTEMKSHLSVDDYDAARQEMADA